MLGRLIAICGPMFSGKTTELLRRLAEHASTGTTTIAIKPVLDDRYAHSEIVSHAGQRLPAHAAGDAAQIETLASAVDVVGIDEAHFFGSALVLVCARMLAAGKQVLVAGLERDHHGEPFEPFPALLCEADEVIKLSGPCAVCGEPAIHSQRMVNATGRIVVGGSESYQPRCRACFVPTPKGQ